MTVTGRGVSDRGSGTPRAEVARKPGDRGGSRSGSERRQRYRMERLLQERHVDHEHVREQRQRHRAKQPFVLKKSAEGAAPIRAAVVHVEELKHHERGKRHCARVNLVLWPSRRPRTCRAAFTIAVLDAYYPGAQHP